MSIGAFIDVIGVSPCVLNTVHTRKAFRQLQVALTKCFGVSLLMLGSQIEFF